MKMLKDTWLMFQRYLFVFLRNPAWVVIGVLQPVLYLVLFAPLLKSLSQTPGFPVGWRVQRVRARDCSSSSGSSARAVSGSASSPSCAPVSSNDSASHR